MNPLRHPGILSVVVVLGLELAGLASCSSTPTADPASFDVPDPAPFISSPGAVTAVFELRCGSLDCHGRASRPLRIYSANGLRLALADTTPPPVTADAGDGGEAGTPAAPTAGSAIPGGADTTALEKRANYQSIVALEPEQMREVSKKDSTTSPTTLLLLGKPLGLQAHKGGTVFTQQSHEAACLIGWLTHKPSPTDCTAAVNEFPKKKTGG